MNVAALIGSPVAHSLSPAIHDAAFAAAGRDWRYVVFDIERGCADAALEAAKVLGVRGLSVTTPHKEQVADCVDELGPSATALRSVNTVVVGDDGRLVGHSTDGDGFVDALAACGVEVTGARVVLLGAGAAARSLVDALGRAGAGDIALVNRTPAHADAAATLAASARLGTLDDVSEAALVVNATSVGMDSDDSPLPVGALHAGQVVADLVYHPLDTTLLRDARAAGATVVDGLEMLVHQAVRQQRLWTGASIAAALLRAAATAELARRANTATDTLR